MVTFSHIFRLGGKDISSHARSYLHGLVATDLRDKNPDRMEERLPGVRGDALRHLLSGSKWDDGEAMRLVCVETDRFLGGREDSALILDECGFEKKGCKSAGVARQYIGRFGKVDNCQMGVFGALCSGPWAQLVGLRLYLPEVWTDSPERCEEAGIPAKLRTFRTKHDLALQIVQEARAHGARFQWVLGDAFYGKSPALLDQFDALGVRFVIDLHRDTHVYLRHPHPRVPPPCGKRGRKPSLLKAEEPSSRVDRIASALPDASWDSVDVRSSTKGTITVRAAVVPVWTWDGCSANVCRRTLLVQREGGPTQWQYKYSLSNAEETVGKEELVRRQRQRFWIERIFEDGKSSCGMGDYQVRTWRGWHHHMTLVAMAMLFALSERLAHALPEPEGSVLHGHSAPDPAASQETCPVPSPTVVGTTPPPSAPSDRPGRQEKGAPPAGVAPLPPPRPSLAALVPFDTVGLSVRDVMHVLMLYLPRQQVTHEQVFRALAKRHGDRQAAVRSAAKRAARANAPHDVAK
jgi:SRSO17 transposase